MKKIIIKKFGDYECKIATEMLLRPDVTRPTYVIEVMSIDHITPKGRKSLPHNIREIRREAQGITDEMLNKLADFKINEFIRGYEEKNESLRMLLKDED